MIKIYVFINKSFINNKNFNNQINFLIVIGIESEDNSKFILKNNIIYINLTKYKKVIRTILTSELYVIIININILIFIFIIIIIIINKFNLLYFLIIVYINFFYTNILLNLI